MRAGQFLWLTIAALACSDLPSGEAGIVGLEIREPENHQLEVGESLQLSAVGLDKDGNEVSAPVTWLAPDPTLTVDANGVATGVAAGTGRVQAASGGLTSRVVTFNVIIRADTLLLEGDSVVTVPAGVAASAPLVVQLRSNVLNDPLPSRPVIYAVTSPPDVGPHTVELPGAVLVDTLTTGADGRVTSVTLNRVNGTTQPDTAIVTVRAERTRGDPVPGSGQRFLVLFQ